MTPLLGLSALLAFVQAGIPAPTIDVRPSTANVSIGERFQVTVEARGPSGMTFEFPKEISNGAVELTQSEPVNAIASVAVYDAQIFALGQDARLPEIEIGYNSPGGAAGSVKTAPVPINIVSSLDPSEANPAPADFAPPVPVLVSRAFWVAAGALGIFLLAAMALLVRRLRFPKPLAEPRLEPALSPEQDGLTRLERLAAERSRLEPRAFYIQLVQILKQYLERRLEQPVLEMTSTETLVLVKSHAWTAPHAPALRDLVTTADLVKFGGFSDASNADRQIQLVRDLVGRIDRLRRAEIERDLSDAGRRRTA